MLVPLPPRGEDCTVYTSRPHDPERQYDGRVHWYPDCCRIRNRAYAHRAYMHPNRATFELYTERGVRSFYKIYICMNCEIRRKEREGVLAETASPSR